MTRIGLLLGIVMLILPGAGQATDLATLYRATLKLEAASGLDPVSATGFVLEACPATFERPAKRVLVTAAHVLLEMPGTEVRLGFRRMDDQGAERFSPQNLPLRAKDGPFWRGELGQDLALMEAPLPAGSSVEVLKLSDLATEAELAQILSQPGRFLQMVGYPKGLSSNRRGYGILRTGALASFPYGPGERLLIDAKAVGGMSGAAVLDPQSGKVVALVIEQVKTDGQALDLAIALPISWVRDQLLGLGCGGIGYPTHR